MRFLMTEKPMAVPLLALRTICNMFAHEAGALFLFVNFCKGKNKELNWQSNIMVKS